MNSDGSDVRQLTALTDDNSAFWKTGLQTGSRSSSRSFRARSDTRAATANYAGCNADVA
jgi:hypothetical protein